MTDVIQEKLEDYPVEAEPFVEVIWERMNGLKAKEIREKHSYSYNIQRKYREVLKDMEPGTRHTLLQNIIARNGEYND